MTRKDEFIGQLEGYLEEYEGSTPLPEHVRGAIRAQLPSTYQRPAWWPARRFPEMNSMMKLSLAAAAVVVAALIGFGFLVAPNVGGPGLDDTSPSPSASASEAAERADFAAYSAGPLVAGEYAFTHIEGIQVVFTVGSGWERNIPNNVVWTVEDDKASMAAFTIGNLYVDPCQPELGLVEPAVGPTVDDLATALEAVPGLTFAAPTPVTRDGVLGVRMDYVPPDGFGADCGSATGDIVLGADTDGVDVYAPSGDQPISYYIYDVDGTRVVITANYTEFRAPAHLDEVLDSIRFE